MKYIIETPCTDPYDHLPTLEWVDKQIEYGSQLHTISGIGLLPYLQKLQGELIGCEIGVCHGFTSEFLLRNIPNIKIFHAVDPYPEFVDSNGGIRLTAERQAEIKARCVARLNPYKEKINFAFTSSFEFVKTLEDNCLDFLFIDGNHSYENTLSDCQLYWPKVKQGGIFAGHDINLYSVRKALETFLPSVKKELSNLTFLENTAWCITKE